MVSISKIRESLSADRPRTVLLATILILTTIPVIETFLVLGHSWQGILPTFTDELNFARLHTIGEGHLTDGNPYYLEHSDGTPLVVFGGAWLNAILLWLGIPWNTALLLNFVLWSILFALALYYLFRELGVSPWVAAAGTVLVYLQSYEHVWRPVNLQPVYPFYFLFYFLFARFVREQSKKNTLLLSLAIGITFYLFTFLWQLTVVTMGLLFFYALVRKKWALLVSTVRASFVGGLLGLPVLLYILWLSHSSPYFWESVSRLGLVNTHLPMAEVIYSGGWIGLLLALIAMLYWRIRTFRTDHEFISLGFFVAVTGLGLWILQGSNLLSGKLTETAEHVKLLILPWLVFSTIAVSAFFWRRRTELSKSLYTVGLAILTLLVAVNLYYTQYYLAPFWNVQINRESWEAQQLYAKPLAWIDAQQKELVVIWSDPHHPLSAMLPVYTRDFTLDSYWGMLELVPDGEIQERYLVSQYFNNPTLADLTSEAEMVLYLGRADLFHKPATHNREVKICRILFFWNKEKKCGTLTTPQEMLGDQFFSALYSKFKKDIQPNIRAYLQKYHVSYILKDTTLDPKYKPEAIGAKLVYNDGRYEIYRLP